MAAIDVLDQDDAINRYYDPATGQFLTVDPAAASTQSDYGYADNDPTNRTDRLGLSAQKCTDGGMLCLDVDGKGEHVNGIAAKFDVPLAQPPEAFIGYQVGIQEVLPDGQIIFRESATYSLDAALYSPSGLDVVDILPEGGLKLPDGTQLKAYLEDPQGNVEACTPEITIKRKPALWGLFS